MEFTAGSDREEHRGGWRLPGGCRDEEGGSENNMKAPAFQLYAADFYMDTLDWTATEVGAYIRLLLREWTDGPLTPKMANLARIAGVDVRNMQKMWSAVLAKKFLTDNAGLLYNPRLEEARQQQIEYIEKQVISGRLGGLKTQEDRRNKPSKPSSKPSSKSKALQSSSSSLKEKEKNIYGSFVELTEDEHDKLQVKFNSHFQDVLDFFNDKIGSKGLKAWRKDHASDYHTILNWERNGWIPNTVTGEIGWAK